MSVRRYTKIAAIAAVAVAAAALVPYASADSSKGIQIPANLANFREPGSTGYVPKTTQIVIPAWLENLQEPGSTGYVPTTHVVIPASLRNFREPGSTGFVPAATVTVTSSGGSGLDWSSAAIGAGAALGLALLAAGAFVMARKRRTLAHA
jgi:hypothetical protein